MINTTPLAPYTVSQVSDAGVQTTDTAQNELKWPFMAAVYHKYRRYDDTDASRACSATFLGGRYLMTSGRCGATLSDGLEDYAIVGINDLNHVGSEGQKVAIRHVYLPDNYQAVTPLSDSFAKPSLHDIAIIELEYEASGTPVKLAPETLADALISGDVMTVMGWKNASDQGFTYSKSLNQSELPYVDRSTCQNLGGNYIYVGDDAVCAGDIADVKGACTGDSGSPLMINHDGTFKQVGIASWGNECSQADPYGVYTSIAKYSDWIKARTSGVSYVQQNVSVTVNKKALVTIPVKNYSDKAFAITGFELPEGVTIFDNQCADEVAQFKSCSVVARVDREKAGLNPEDYDTELKLKMQTSHPEASELPVTIHFNNNYDKEDTFEPGMYLLKKTSVSANKITLVKVQVPNHTGEAFSISDFELADGVTIYDNRCPDVLAENDTCSVIVRVDREKAGMNPEDYDTEVNLSLYIRMSQSGDSVLPAIIHFSGSYQSDDTYDPGMSPSEFPGTPEDLENGLD
ncbi:S1 family peptidase [Vibrio quintilis]|uniref:S1 family peptidase n=1 Tax=Vibrio quintilis TaxID=1117707 RepID=UPI0021C9792F|nr:serine protease [Vibrio quintilis]